MNTYLPINVSNMGLGSTERNRELLFNIFSGASLRNKNQNLFLPLRQSARVPKCITAFHPHAFTSSAYCPVILKPSFRKSRLVESRKNKSYDESKNDRNSYR